VFLSISPSIILGKSDISAEKSIELAAERINISSSKIQIREIELISVKLVVIAISMIKRVVISLLKGIRSITIPMIGASTTAGSIAVAAVIAMRTASALNYTSIEKIATCENQVPK